MFYRDLGSAVSGLGFRVWIFRVVATQKEAHLLAGPSVVYMPHVRTQT